MEYRFSVAISFLTSDKAIALRLRDELQMVLPLPVFVYPDRQVELTGKTFENALSPVFETQSRVVVVLHRTGWGKQGGTLIEYRAVNRRRLRSDESFLFPILVERDAPLLPWADDLIYFDLSHYDLNDAVCAIVRMVTDHEREHPSPTVRISPNIAKPQTKHLICVMREVLHMAFVTAYGPLRGYFSTPDMMENDKRWQSKGGESTIETLIPKRPYYHTYWGYKAAMQLVPKDVNKWSSLTLEAISSHFEGGRWLKVVRDYAFSDGPLMHSQLSETVRHTARAAELVHLLAPSHQRCSDVAWNLINEASNLQDSNGGWMEFRGETGPPSLWATVYIYRLFSNLRNTADKSIPDERDAFLDYVEPLLSTSEEYLARQWKEDRWQIKGTVSWEEGAAAVIAEVGQFISDDSLILDVFQALRSRLAPSGRLLNCNQLPCHLTEIGLALRIAFGLKSCNRGLADADSRYGRLVAWLSEVLDPRQLTVYEVACAAAILDLRAEEDYIALVQPSLLQGNV